MIVFKFYVPACCKTQVAVRISLGTANWVPIKWITMITTPNILQIKLVITWTSTITLFSNSPEVQGI